MQHNELIETLADKDFHINTLGRMVIDNNEILTTINGAMSEPASLLDMLCNGGCVNASCC